MIAQLVHDWPRHRIEAVVGKMQAEQRHQAVLVRLTEQMRPVYSVAEQRSDPLGPFVVDGAPGTAQEQFGLRTHVQWEEPVFFTTETAEDTEIRRGRLSVQGLGKVASSPK